MKMAKDRKNPAAEEKSKRKIDPLGLILRCLLVIAAGLFVTLAVVSWPSIRENGFYATFFGTEEEQGTLERAEEIEFVANTRNVFCAYREGAAILGPSGLQVVRPDGSTEIDEAKSFTNPVLRCDGGWLLAYDSGGTGMILVEDGKVKANDSAPGDLIFAEVNGSGWRLMIRQSDNWRAVATVIDEDGRTVYELSSAERYLIGGDVSPDGTRTALAGVRQLDAQILSSVYIFEHSSAEADPMAFWEDPNGMVLSAEFLDDETILVLTDEAAVFVDGDTGAENARYEFGAYNLTSYGVGDGFVSLALTGASGLSCRVVTLDFHGTELASRVTGGVEDMDAEGADFGILTNDGFVVYNNNLESVAQGPCPAGSRKLLVARGGTVYVITSGAASVYQY